MADLRHAERVSALHAELEDIRWGKQPDEVELARLWTAGSDARSHIVIGDPAVRLSVPLAERPMLEPGVSSSQDRLKAKTP